jgi:hypothetical protein
MSFFNSVIAAPPKRKILMRLLKLETFLVCVFIGLIAVPPSALARKPFLADFNSEYGTADSRLDTCGVCHYNFDGAGARNPYGEAFLIAGNFSAIEDVDSDVDGTTSIDEILALFMPGLTCTNLGLTSNAPAGIANYVDPNNPGCGSAAPDIQVVPLALEFGPVTVGVPATLMVEISNVGDADLTVSEMIINGSMDFDFGSGFPTTGCARKRRQRAQPSVFGAA